MKKILYRLLRICPCYDYPDKFFTIKIGEDNFTNICMGCIFKCDTCGRILYKPLPYKHKND